ncbi:unnamed protein product, partial [Staurois parvus]
MGPYIPPPHAAAKSRVVFMGPYTASHCCCLHRSHSAMCHFQVSSHTAGVQSLSWVPVRPPIAAVSIATLC